MSNFTFNLELDSKINKDGKRNIRIRITQDRKHRRVSTTCDIKKEHFVYDKNIGRYKVKTGSKGDLSGEFMNEKIRKILVKAESEILNLSMMNVHVDLDLAKKIINGEYSAAKYHEEIERKKLSGENEKENYGKIDFFEYTQKFLDRIENTNYGTFRIRRSTRNKLLAYHGEGKPLYFKDMTVAWLKDYESYLKGLGNKVNTIHSDLKDIRAWFNDAIKDDKLFGFDLYPFHEFSIKRERTTKEKLSLEEVKAFFEVDILDPKVDAARDTWALSYYIYGMRIGDIVFLQDDNIKNDRIVYRMGKSHKMNSIKLNAPAKVILEKYSGKGNKYLFPFVNPNKDYKTDKEIKGEGSSAVAKIRKLLKIAAALAGIQMSVSSHQSRHTFAYHAYQKTKDIRAIQKALNHSKIETTEGYLKDMGEDDMDNFSDKFYGE